MVVGPCFSLPVEMEKALEQRVGNLDKFLILQDFILFMFFLLCQDILKQIKVKNLDTGEEMDLVKAEDQLPQSINPLSLHIMRLTSEYCVRYGKSKVL